MSEAALVNKIREAMKKKGLFCLKLHGGRFQQAGLPDLLVIKEGRALWLEVKTQDGETTKLQEHALDALRKSGCVAEVVRSVDEAIRLVNSTPTPEQ